MTNYQCTRCGWTGSNSDLIEVPICPNCDVGHSPQWRMKKKGNVWECQNCFWRGSDDMVVREGECPKCRNEYLKEIGELE
ncbi:MAG: hypothetical protein ACTSVY_03710 [Candidatus Helarchaeota archaeon]